MSKIVESLSIEEAFKLLNRKNVSNGTRTSEDYEVFKRRRMINPELTHRYFYVLTLGGGKNSGDSSTHIVSADLRPFRADYVLEQLPSMSNMYRYIDGDYKDILGEHTTYEDISNKLSEMLKSYQEKAGDNCIVFGIYSDKNKQLIAGDDSIRVSIVDCLESNSHKCRTLMAKQAMSRFANIEPTEIYLAYDINSDDVANLKHLKLFNAAKDYLKSIS